MTSGSGDQAGAEALRVLGWGTTAGVAALSLPLLYPVSRLGVRLRPTLHLDRPVARRALRLGGAGVWTLIAQQISTLAVLALARSGGRAGTVAVYQYVQAVYMLPYAVMAVPVATVVYPRLAAAFDADGGSDAGGGPNRYPPRAVELAATSTALVAAVALAGGGALMASSAAAERFFALLTDVEGMGVCLTVLAPALVGYALVHQVTRILFAAGRARPAAHATALGWVTVAGASTVAVRLMAPALVVGARAVGPTLRALVVGAPIALLAGLGARTVSARAGTELGSIVIGAVGAVACAGVVMGVCTAADRRLLSGLRSGDASAGTPSPREGQ